MNITDRMKDVLPALSKRLCEDGNKCSAKIARQLVNIFKDINNFIEYTNNIIEEAGNDLVLKEIYVTAIAGFLDVFIRNIENEISECVLMLIEVREPCSNFFHKKTGVK